MNSSVLHRVRVIAVAAALIAVIGGGTYALIRQPGPPRTPAQSNQPVAVQVAAATTGPINSVLTYSGAIEASQQVSLAPRLAGQLASVTVDVGDVVREGDTLATLDPGTLPASLQQARAALQSANARLALMLDGPRSADVAASEAALTAAEAGLAALLNPSSADLTAARAGVNAAQVTLDNAHVAVDTARNSLISALAIYCRTVNAVIVRCETDLPIPEEDFQLLQRHLNGNSTYTLTNGGTRALTLMATNNAYLTALNAISPLERALGVAKDNYGRLVSPSAAAIAAQRSAVAATRAALTNRKEPYTAADISGARAAVAAAQAGVAAAGTSLAQTSVVAPFDGVIAARLLDVGATVSPQAPIFVLVAMAVESHLTVDEARIGLIRPGMTAKVVVPAFPGRAFTGRVETIAPLGDARAHTFDVKVFAEDPGKLLRPGMFAQVDIVVATESDAILVPTLSIVPRGEGSVVYVVENGKAVARPVTAGIANATSTEIVRGIAAGEQVVMVGQNILHDGQAVTVAAPAAARP